MPTVHRSPTPATARTGTNRLFAAIGYDAEGIATRPDGGYWNAAEGVGEQIPNLFVDVDVDASGAVVREVPLPAEIAANATSNGFEGVTTGAPRR